MWRNCLVCNNLVTEKKTHALHSTASVQCLNVPFRLPIEFFIFFFHPILKPQRTPRRKGFALTCSIFDRFGPRTFWSNLPFFWSAPLDKIVPPCGTLKINLSYAMEEGTLLMHLNVSWLYFHHCQMCSTFCAQLFQCVLNVQFAIGVARWYGLRVRQCSFCRPYWTIELWNVGRVWVYNTIVFCVHYQINGMEQIICVEHVGHFRAGYKSNICRLRLWYNRYWVDIVRLFIGNHIEGMRSDEMY